MVVHFYFFAHCLYFHAGRFLVPCFKLNKRSERATHSNHSTIHNLTLTFNRAQHIHARPPYCSNFLCYNAIYEMSSMQHACELFHVLITIAIFFLLSLCKYEAECRGFRLFSLLSGYNFRFQLMPLFFFFFFKHTLFFALFENLLFEAILYVISFHFWLLMNGPME